MLPAAAQTFISQQVSNNTAEAYKFDLLSWFNFIVDRKPTEELAIEYRKYLETTYSPRTAARRHNTIRSFYRWMGGDNVFTRLRAPRRLRNATPAVPLDGTIERLLDGTQGARDAAILALLLNGLRASEVIGLAPTDFVWSPEYGCHIIRVRGKGFKERLVPATIETSQRVSAYQAISKRGTPWLLSALTGNAPMTRRQVTEALRRACKRAGIPDINPHALRHHYGTRLVRAGANVFAIQKMMGHESISTTQVYIQLDLADIVKANNLDPRNRKESNVEDYVDQRTAGRTDPQRPERAAEGVRPVHFSEGRVQ